MSGTRLADHRSPLAALNGENSRAKVQNVREDSWARRLRIAVGPRTDSRVGVGWPSCLLHPPRVALRIEEPVAIRTLGVVLAPEMPALGRSIRADGLSGRDRRVEPRISGARRPSIQPWDTTGCRIKTGLTH